MLASLGWAGASMSKDVLLIGASVVALVVVSAATFFCARRRPHSQRSDALGRDDVEIGGVNDARIDETTAVLQAAYPPPTLVVFSFSPPPHQRGENETETDKEKEKKKEEEGDDDEEENKAASGTTTRPAGDTAARCAVCQAEYDEGDELRLLPECRHAFHRRCVDQWLRRRPTCPVCRRRAPS